MHTKNILTLALVLILVILACNLSAPPQPAPPTAIPPTTIPPTPVPPPTVAVEKEFSAVFDTAGSGSLCPQGPTPVDNGDTPSVIGERGDSYDCEGFWTFDIRGVPSSSTVLSVTFLPGVCTTSGTPFSFGDLSFELVDVGNLDVSDYGMGGVGKFQGGAITSLWKSCSITGLDITDHVKSVVKQGSKTIQIRGYMTSGNFSNGVDDYVSFRTGAIPTIIIRYK